MPIGLPGAQPDGDNRYRSVGHEFLTTMQDSDSCRDATSTKHDRTTSQPVAVVSEEFAKINFHWPEIRSGIT